MPQQVLQKLEFPGRQIDVPAAPGHLPADEIHVEVANTQPERLARTATAKQGPDAGQQLFEGKGFDEIVIGAAVEPGYSIFQTVAGGKQQNRRCNALFPQARQDLKAVTAGEHQIKENDVEFLSRDAK